MEKNEKTYRLHISGSKLAETINDVKQPVYRGLAIKITKTAAIFIILMTMIILGSIGNMKQPDPSEWVKVFYNAAFTVVLLCGLLDLKEHLHNLNIVRRGLKRALSHEFAEYNTPSSDAKFRNILHDNYVTRRKDKHPTLECLFRVLLMVIYDPMKITMEKSPYHEEEVIISYKTPCGANIRFDIPEKVLFRFFNKLPETTEGTKVLTLQ